MAVALQQAQVSELWIPQAQILSWIISYRSTHQARPTVEQLRQATGENTEALSSLLDQGLVSMAGDGHLQAAEQWVELPIIGSVAAGSPIEAVAHQHGQMSLPLECFRQRPTYLLRVRGDSMIDDGINDGDLIAVRKTQQAGEGKIVVARVDNEVTVKRLKLMKDQVGLMPANKDYQPIMVAPEALVIEGEFVGLIRGDRSKLAH